LNAAHGVGSVFSVHVEGPLALTRWSIAREKRGARFQEPKRETNGGYERNEWSKKVFGAVRTIIDHTAYAVGIGNLLARN